MDTVIQIVPVVQLEATELDKDSSIIDIHVEDSYSEPMKE